MNVDFVPVNLTEVSAAAANPVVLSSAPVLPRMQW